VHNHKISLNFIHNHWQAFLLLTAHKQPPPNQLTSKLICITAKSWSPGFLSPTKDHGCPFVANMDDPTTAAELPVLQNIYWDLITFSFCVKQWESEGLVLLGYTHITNTIMYKTLGFLIIYFRHKNSTADGNKSRQFTRMCRLYTTNRN